MSNKVSIFPPPPRLRRTGNFQFSKTAKAIFVASALVFLAAGCTTKLFGVPRNGETTKVYQEAKKQLDPAQTVKYEGEEGKTALQILKDKYQVDTKEYQGLGEFVTSISGIKAEDGKNFWAFYVNGKQAQVGASSYQTKNGEQ
ncbi:MAG: DUF4430 domain-containing protein, partial [Candidatus Doudnabacteria bacterium]|nr:DUF4430 domain-containing protein [Candidatus Doudnabacteria bacterium]